MPRISSLPSLLVLVTLAAALPARALKDVAVQNVVGPADATVGFPVSVAFELVNLGDQRIEGYRIGLFLSPDPAISYFDRKLAEQDGPPLEPNERRSVQLSGTVPSTMAPGTYTLGIIADALGSLGESGQRILDNIGRVAPATQLKVPSPDFVLHDLAWGGKVAAGEVVEVRVGVDNRGVREGPAEGTPITFFLSTNDNVTRSDQPVGQLLVQVAPGESRLVSAWVRLPATLAPGRYFLGAWIDPTEQIFELSETNNKAVSQSVEVFAGTFGIETTWLPDALVGVPYVRALVASGGDAAYEWSLAAGALPPGLTLATNGVITGAATTAGTFSPVIEVRSGGRATRLGYILRSFVPTTPVEVATQDLPPAVAGVDYEAPLAATGGTPPYTWKLNSGTLPNGFSIAPAGFVKGRANAPPRPNDPTPTFAVEVTDASGAVARGALTLRVLGTGDLAILQRALDDALAGESYTATIDPQGGTAPFRWALASGRLPSGVALAGEGQSLVLSGKPRESGIFVFSLRLEDSAGQADRNTFVLRVGPAAISVLTTELPAAERGAAYDAPLSANANENEAHWRLAGGELPPGITLTADGHLRTVEGRVSERSPLRFFTFIVEVSDDTGATGRAGLSIEVVAAPAPPPDDTGCASVPVASLALLAFAFARRRRAASLLAVLALALPARAQSSAEYFVALQDEAAYEPIPDGTSLDTRGERDDGEVEFTLPFPFPYFGEGQTAVSVGTNGYLAFGGEDGSRWSNQALPNASRPNNLLAPWWDDLEVKATGGLRWKVVGDAPARVAIIEWSDLTHVNATGASPPGLSFQARLGEDGSLSFHYAPLPSSTTGLTFTATVGLENKDGTVGQLALTCNASCGTGNFPAGKRLVFTRHLDLVAQSVTAPSIAYGSLPATFTATVRNHGSLPARDVVVRLFLSADRELDAQQDVELWSQTIPQLLRGESKTLSTGAVPLPDIAAGSWQPILVVDPDNDVSESVETNNVKLGEPLRVGAPAPDFRVISVSNTTQQAAPGDTFEVPLRLANIGNLAGTARWRAVVSVNDILSLADRTVALGELSLGPGADEAVTASCTLPVDLQPGRYRVGVLADAPEDTADQTAEIDEFNNAAASEQPLLVAGPATIETPAELPAATVGASYFFRLSAAGGDGLYIWSAQNNTRPPAGMVLRNTGELEGVPTTAGAVTFTVKLTTDGQVLTREFTLRVDPPNLALGFVSAALPAAIFGREYETRLAAFGGVPPYAFALAADSESQLPAGLALDTNGLLGGVPVNGGTFPLKIQVTDRQSKTATRELSLAVLPPGRPVIDARPLPEAFVGQGYEAQLTAIGGRTPYKWALVDVRRFASLPGEASQKIDKPAGLAFTPDGKLTGTPTELGLYALVVQVTDAGNLVDQDTVLLQVRAERGIAILTSQMPPAEADRPYDESIVATGGDGLLTFSLLDASQVLPEGLTLRPDGRLQGTPANVGHRTFIVQVQDEARRFDIRALTVVVKPHRQTEDPGDCSHASADLVALAALLALVIVRRRRLVPALLVPAAVVLGSLAVSACGDVEEPRAPCEGVVCQPGEVCDPTDNSCKCGGENGRACTVEEACNPATLSCELLDRCALIRCTRGMACDGADGTCKCGTLVCAEDEQCDPSARRCVSADRCANVACVGGSSCDPADGACKCGGPGGSVCGAGQVCEAGICKDSLCASVVCTGGTTCDPADGRCRCGGAGGQICLYGQYCDDQKKECLTSTRCARVSCGAGMSCDPSDGTCRCGGAGGRICSAGQTCDVESGQCIGGNRCANVSCASGTTCDPEDGRCHCGSGGPVCGSDEVCDAGQQPSACRRKCDPVAQTPCTGTESCVYSTSARVAMCSAAGTKVEDATCTASSECGRGLHCAVSFGAGTCRYYCARPNGTCTTVGRTCKALTGAPADLGVCSR